MKTGAKENRIDERKEKKKNLTGKWKIGEKPNRTADSRIGEKRRVTTNMIGKGIISPAISPKAGPIAVPKEEMMNGPIAVPKKEMRSGRIVDPKAKKKDDGNGEKRKTAAAVSVMRTAPEERNDSMGSPMEITNFDRIILEGKKAAGEIPVKKIPGQTIQMAVTNNVLD